LDEEEEFRYAIAGYIGLSEILKMLEAQDRKFNEILERLEKHDKLIEEVLLKLKSHDERFEAHDRKFNEILEEIRIIEKEMANLSRRVEVTIGSMGRRWGRDLEKMVYEIFEEGLIERRIEVERIRKFKYVDADGSITGVKGKTIDVDILATDDRLYIIEVKSRAEMDHVNALIDKARYIENILKHRVDKILIIAVNIDSDALDYARRIGIDVLYENVV